MLVAEPEEEILFVYEHQHPNSASAGGKTGNGNGEENLPLVQLKTMPDTIKMLMHSYAQLRGKQYNDRLVLSPHYTRQIVSMMRAFCRYGTLAVIGPPGCGRKSAVTFCAHMMDLELVTCPLDDFDNLFRIIKETYCMANNENPRLILVEMDKANKNTRRALDLLNKIIHYYDIPGAFDNEDKMKQLFDEDTDRKEALLDSKAMIDALDDLVIRIKVIY